MLKSGGKKVLLFLLIPAVFAFLQNALAVGLAGAVGIDPLLALLTASPALTGGHGTSAAVAPSIEALRYLEALTVALTAATFGLVAGSLLGGPMANRLIIKGKLTNKKKLSEKYVYSKTAFFVVPIVGSLFIDFINIGIIQVFISFLY